MDSKGGGVIEDGGSALTPDAATGEHDAAALDAAAPDAAQLDSDADVSTSGDADAVPPAEPSCGDGTRDPSSEECDDGSPAPNDGCSDDCRVRTVGVNVGAPGTGSEPLLASRPHVLAASDRAIGWTYVQAEQVRLALFGASGAPLGIDVNVGDGRAPTSQANPVVAALPGGRFAVAWTDGADGTCCRPV
jgi:cysteine-rich repeat protein